MREAAVFDVSVYLVILQSVLPDYDFAVVLTRQDLAADFAGTDQDAIAYASGDTICTDTDGSSTGLVEVSSPNFLKAIAQSILLGFGLPYLADASSLNVMGRNYDTSINKANRAARWNLALATQTPLATRVVANGACLQNLVTDSEYLGFLATLPYGSTYDQEDQCNILYGGDSTSCPVRSARVCFDGMTCTSPGTDTCDLAILYGDRTTCEQGKGCRYGSCGFDFTTMAPTTLTPTTVAPVTTTLAPRTPTPTTPGDCCCERRPLGNVVISMTYEPCP